MSIHRSLFSARVLWLALLAFFVVFTGAVRVAGQSGQPPSGPQAPPDPDLRRETRERQYSEARLRGAGAAAEIARLDENRIRAGIKKTKEDFKRIQLIRNAMVDNLLARKPHDYKLVAEQASDVNNSALRLKSYLLPPLTEESKKEVEAINLTDAQLTSAMVELCNTIYSFTQNPVLKSLETTDVKESTRAGGDLLEIIELSHRIHKSAERLKNAPR